MIKVESIEINGIFSPVEITDTKFGSHFDGELFYFFESEKEKSNFYLNLESNNSIQND
jgi:hypothetical protein